MKNAAERLWPALAAGDRHRAASELHERVTLEWPHTGERFEGREAYLAAVAGVPGIASAELRCAVTEGRHVATEVRLDGWTVASFFTLHDGRVLHATEYWVPAR